MTTTINQIDSKKISWIEQKKKLLMLLMNLKIHSLLDIKPELIIFDGCNYCWETVWSQW